MSVDVDFGWVPGAEVDPGTLEECSALYSGHYGFWSMHSPWRPGERIRQSPKAIRELLEVIGSGLALARHKGELIGYATVARGEVADHGRITWVTQLVVHEDFRHRGVAKRLLSSIWSFTDQFAWGLVTANPFAVRALERATRRRCVPAVIRAVAEPVLRFGEQIPYVAGREILISESESRINTQFFVDHSGLEQMLAEASAGAPWLLGKIGEGEEWFAFTFGEQQENAWTAEDLVQVLADADQIAREALGRMSLDQGHKWMKHTAHEVGLLRESLQLTRQMRFLDFGCGIGRHTLELGKEGFSGVGVDFLPEFIERASAEAAEMPTVAFVCGDCRTVSLGESFDAAFCLYDVIGTFPDDAENDAIIRNLARHLRNGARVLVSVLNLEVTAARAKHVGDVARNPEILSHLPPSRTMQDTGNIFDPDFYLLDPTTSVVYRKEQFEDDYRLPAEAVVRDRRYRRSELCEKMAAFGITEIWSRYVQAGHWDVGLDSVDSRAKEILFLGEKI